MADLDLLSYERDSRWMPHLSWAYPDWTLQQRMEAQVAQREQAFQKIADKLGPLLIGSNIGSSFGQSNFISRDFDEDEEYLARAYEKAPLLSSHTIQRRSQTHQSYQTQSQSLRNSQQFSFMPSQSYTQTPTPSTQLRSETLSKSRSPSSKSPPSPASLCQSEHLEQELTETTSGSESGSSLQNASKIVKTIWSCAAQSVWDFIYLLKSAFCASLQREQSLA